MTDTVVNTFQKTIFREIKSFCRIEITYMYSSQMKCVCQEFKEYIEI